MTNKAKLSSHLWMVEKAEEAAKFYTNLLPVSKIHHVSRYPAGIPGYEAGSVMTVDITLMGTP